MAPSLLFSSQFLISLIKWYQVLISPLLGSNCRFNPTCSQYAIEVLYQFGLIKGIWLIVKRILKCSPLYRGGDDPVPLPKQNNHNREYL